MLRLNVPLLFIIINKSIAIIHIYMFDRILSITKTLERKSLFLFGPRQTGKSMYLRTHFPKALYINLLKASEYQQHVSHPNYLAEIVVAYIKQHKESKTHIVIIDEVQKIPGILDEVHNLIETYKTARFILTGSSSRKFSRTALARQNTITNSIVRFF